MTNELEKLSNSCRLCLAEKQDVSLLSYLEKNYQFYEIALMFTNIEFSENDGLPQLICEECASLLTNFYTFKKRCELSHCTLTAVLVNNFNSNSEEIYLESEEEVEIIFGDTIEQLSNDSSENEYVYKLNSDIEIEEKIEEDPTDLETIQNETKSKRKRKKEHECKECGSFFESPSHLKRHSYKHILNTKRGRPEKNRSYSCRKCGKMLQKLDDVKVHIELCKILNVTKNESNLFDDESDQHNVPKIDQHIIMNKVESNELKHQCDQCGRTFFQKSTLLQHTNTHTGVKNFSCEICDTKFTRRSHLEIHMRRHYNIRPYVCDICKRSFTKSGDLARHKRIHTDERNYLCTICPKQFKRSNDVISHMRVHTGQKPFCCKLCPKAYTSHSSLKKHIKTHTNPKVKEILM